MFPVNINQNVVGKASKVSAVFKMFFLYANTLTLKTEILFWNPSLSYYCISPLWLSNVTSLMKPNPLNATAASHWQQIKNKVSVISSKPQTLAREKRTRSCLRRSTRSTLGPRTWGTRATSWRYWPRWPRPSWPRPSWEQVFKLCALVQMKECRTILHLEEYFESGLQSVILTEYLEVRTSKCKRFVVLLMNREESCSRESAARSTGSPRISAECSLSRFLVMPLEINTWWQFQIFVS